MGFPKPWDDLPKGKFPVPTYWDYLGAPVDNGQPCRFRFRYRRCGGSGRSCGENQQP
ncbi:hypothetical protein CCACVL1_01176 [Corchorus capsularis]|uniref:Uncharacterized protein n=1 Tax=Corchorus capsularis TaxID=210143 RepID=A0A1R3KLR3_COCAP|nr:hypothetical protein CCACVL1_01176 [Corchorus capsularis]